MSEILGRDGAIVGMVHLHALPGSPRSTLSPRAIAQLAVEEARALDDAGFDAILLENMHDAPYLAREVGPEVIAAFTRAACEVRAAVAAASTNPFPPSPPQAAPAALELSELTAIGPLDG